MAVIAAVSTAPGEGGISIVRASGRDAGVLLEKIFRPAKKRAVESHRMMYGCCVDDDGSVIDEVMAVYFAAPYTYTRENMFEIQCHGGDICARRILKRIIDSGARIAAPGEFTRLAFMNGRIDLSKAEAVMQIIGANSEAAARASVRQLSGGVSSFVSKTIDELKDLLATIEACVDFPEEVDTESTGEQVCRASLAIADEIDRRTDERGARILMKGADIVLAGRPNVGKSSLMNALLNRERAIVTNIPGTTRDVLTEMITLDGISARLSDTAGQRVTDDAIEQIGVQMAEKAVEKADLVILVIDGSGTVTEEDQRLLDSMDERYVVCVNKADKGCMVSIDGAIHISAKTGAGVDELLKVLSERIAVVPVDDGFTGERHIELAKSASGYLRQAADGIMAGFEADTVRIDLKEALEKLCDITGENATEEVIDRVFANFCVGK